MFVTVTFYKDFFTISLGTQRFWYIGDSTRSVFLLDEFYSIILTLLPNEISNEIIKILYVVASGSEN